MICTVDLVVVAAAVVVVVVVVVQVGLVPKSQKQPSQ